MVPDLLLAGFSLEWNAARTPREFRYSTIKME
jgi:hypothetical protein